MGWNGMGLIECCREKLKQIKLVAADGGGDDADAGLHMHKEAENDGILKRSRWWAIGASIVSLLSLHLSLSISLPSILPFLSTFVISLLHV